MSIPIPACLGMAAARGDETAFAELKRRLEYNIKWGHWSVWPCECKPPCERPTEEQMKALDERLKPIFSNMTHETEAAPGRR